MVKSQRKNSRPKSDKGYRTTTPRFCFFLKPRFFLSVLLLAVVLTFTPPKISRGERPFETEMVGFKSENELRIDFGLDYSHIDSRQDLLAFPSLGISYAAGTFVDLQASYDFLYRFTRNGTTIYGSGDLMLWTKLKFVTEKENFPGLGLRFGVKLPNANSNDGLGTDQTDFYASILTGKKIGRFESRLNLGIAILDDPFKLQGQQDMLTFALASLFDISASWKCFIDFYSQQGAEARFRFSKVSGGVRFQKGEWGWDIALKKGLRSDNKGYRDELSLDWGIVLGVSRFIDLHKN